ncbi:MAG: acetate kinase [Rhodoferax sp.]|nr:acetate kinase [Rhodoferax sp.]
MQGEDSPRNPIWLAQAPAQDIAPVGQPPQSQSRPPEVAPIFEQPGVLTPPGQTVLEPSLQYSYSSSNRVALVGYTVIPALLIGLVDVREVKRSSTTGALTARYGLTRRLEIEGRLPYTYRSDSTVSRDIANPSSSDRVFDADGIGIGDVELAARYQINEGGPSRPYYIGSLRLKTRTGRDPFEVVTDCITACVGNASGSGLPLTLPTGSGFNSVQLGLTVLYPSDPAVFFGGINYTHQMGRDGVSRRVLNNEEEYIGTITPGAAVGFNVGMGLAINEKSSFSLGYDHVSIGRTEVNGQVQAGSVRTQLATLLLGYSYRLNPRTALNLSIGAGLTRDTPDLSLTLRMPTSF